MAGHEGTLLVDVQPAQMHERQRTGIADVLDIGQGQLHLALRGIVRLQPGHIGAQAFLPAQADDGSLGKRLPCGQIVGSAAVEVVTEGIAQVERIVLEHETVADGHILAARRNIQSIGPQQRQQITGFPAQIGRLPRSLILVAAAVEAGIAITPSGTAQTADAAI
ncbi:hypothetical protein D3C85_1169500 [compost metagenome]